GRLRPADITGGTFTLSNLGMYKVDAFSAIITPPQAAVLAVGAISERVVPVEGKPAVRPVMTMTLSSDHRVVDGARAAEVLSDLAGATREAMELPERSHGRRTCGRGAYSEARASERKEMQAGRQSG